MDFYDKDRYATRKFFNNLRDAIWSMILTIITIALIGAAVYFLMPWLTVMWRAIRQGVIE